MIAYCFYETATGCTYNKGQNSIIILDEGIVVLVNFSRVSAASSLSWAFLVAASSVAKNEHLAVDISWAASRSLPLPEGTGDKVFMAHCNVEKGVGLVCLLGHVHLRGRSLLMRTCSSAIGWQLDPGYAVPCYTIAR